VLEASGLGSSGVVYAKVNLISSKASLLSSYSSSNFAYLGYTEPPIEDFLSSSFPPLRVDYFLTPKRPILLEIELANSLLISS